MLISKIKNCLNNASSCKTNKKEIGKRYQEKTGYLLQSLYLVKKTAANLLARSFLKLNLLIPLINF